MEENGKSKEEILEAARRFCDLMEEDEDISLAQSMAACKELGDWLENTSDVEIIAAACDCFSNLLERLDDGFRPLFGLTVPPLLTTLGQRSKQPRVNAIMMLTNLIEVFSSKEIFEMVMNGFAHEDFFIREGCCLLILSTIRRLGKKSGFEDLIASDLNFAQALVTIAVTDPAGNARAASSVAICELIKIIGYQAREAFDNCAGADDDDLQEKMNTVKIKKPVQVTVNGEWMDDVSKADMTVDEIYARLDTIRYAMGEGGLDPEERIKMLRKLRAIIYHHNKISGKTIWEEIGAFFPKFAIDVLKLRKLTATTREVCLTIQQICSIPSSPDTPFDDAVAHLIQMLPRISDSSSQTAETAWNALKMCVRRYQHTKVVRVILAGNPGTNPQLKERNTPPVRRKVMSLLESVLTLWEDARPLRKQRSGLVEAINAGIYDADGETRKCARRAWHGLHSHFPNDAADMLRKLTTAQQNLILGKVAESRMPSRNGSRANSPGRRAVGRPTRTQPGSRTGSPGRNRRPASGAMPKPRVPLSRGGSPGRTKTAARVVNRSRTTVGSRAGSPGRGSRVRSSTNQTPEDRTVSVIRAISSSNLADKKAGLEGFKRLLKQKVAFRTPELKKILESFKAILAGRSALFLTALDTLSEFLLVCGPVLDYPWCSFLVPALTNKAADSSLPGQSLAAVVKARTNAIETLNPTWQLSSLSKYITDDEAKTSGPRHKVQILVWLTALAPRIEEGELESSEVRSAIIRIAQWGGEISRDNRSTNRTTTQIRKCAHEALKALEKSCGPDFEALLDNLPPTTTETCRYLLESTFSITSSRTASKQGSRVGSRIGSRAGSRTVSPSRRPASRGATRPGQTRSEPNSSTKIPRAANGISSKVTNGSSSIPTFRKTSSSSKPSTPTSLVPPKMAIPLDSPSSTLTPSTPKTPATAEKILLEPASSSSLPEPNSVDTLSSQLSQMSVSSSNANDKSSANLNLERPDSRPPPSPCRSEEGTSESLAPAVIFIDGNSKAADKLVALESLEPELLDEMEISRVLLALEKCIKDKEESVLQQAAFEMISKMAELCPKSFQNFTSGIVKTLVTLSTDESCELQSEECLETLSKYLPAISLIEPFCEGITQAENDEIKGIFFGYLIPIPAKVAKEAAKPSGSGDASSSKDFSETNAWSRMSQISLEAIKSNLSSMRKNGCTLLANMSLATKNQEAVDKIVGELSGAAQKLANSYIKKASNEATTTTSSTI